MRPGTARAGPTPLGLDLASQREQQRLGLWQGSYLAAFSWAGQVIVFFILISHLAVNLANPLYHLRYRRERFSWLTNAAVPALGLAIDGYVLLWRSSGTCSPSRSHPVAASPG